jgi:hypothetical protein
MKHLRETFTDQEFLQLQYFKEMSKLTWHDYIFLADNLVRIQNWLRNFKGGKIETFDKDDLRFLYRLIFEEVKTE